MNLSRLFKLDRTSLIAFFIGFVFFFAYLTLSLVKHAHYWTGYDLSITNQIVWEFSRFTLPISSVHAYAFTPVFSDHVEFVYAIISPFYWILPDARMLIILQVLAFILSGIPIYLLAKRHKINNYLSLAFLISYYMFFGVQNALWSDVHSLVFGISSLSFFIYFLDVKKKWPALLFFVLALVSKEDMGFLAFFISFVYFLKTRWKLNLFVMMVSFIYVFVVFFVYYPNFTLGYQYAGENGVLSNINLLNYFNTPEKRSVFIYSFLQTGFLSLLNPLFLIPYLLDLGHYFVLGERVTSAQGLFLHYRVTSAILLIWPAILVIGKFKKLNNKYLALYVLFFAFLVTYLLHSPLTYLSKKWFWTTPTGVKNIEKAIEALPKDAYVVTQTNISPHISNRKLIVTMWGEGKDFEKNSPCGEPKCDWFKWSGDPKFMLVDTAPEWNILHLLANREDFISALSNMEREGVIKKYKQIGTSTIYTVHKRPY